MTTTNKLSDTINGFVQNTKVLSNLSLALGLGLKPNVISKESTVVPMHIARTGTFNGYKDGSFELTQEMFDECINNFYSEKNPIPVYKGHADVQGSLTGEEPPSMGWILGLKQDDQGNLFAMVELTEELASMIKAGNYKFTSIYMKGNEINRESGEEIGCRLASLAMTNQPFIDGLSSVALSQNTQNLKSITTYISKEINNKGLTESTDMKTTNKKSIKLAMPSKPAVAQQATEEDTEVAMADTTNQVPVESPTEQMNAMQDGKVVEDSNEVSTVDPMAMLEEVRAQVSPDMSMEDFISQLLGLLQSEITEPTDTEIAEEMDLAQTDVSNTPEQEAAVEKKEASMPIAASNVMVLSATVKSLNLALSNANSQINSLKQEIQKRDDLVLSSIVDEAIKQGKLNDLERSSFIKLGSVDRNLFDELLTARKVSPSIVLSRVTRQDASDTTSSTERFKKSLSKMEEDMLKGAKVKI
jgi:phage I-like protein